MKQLSFLGIFSFFFLSLSLLSQSKEDRIIYSRPAIDSAAKSAMMNGNSITVKVFNNSSVSPGLGLIRNVNNFVWNGLGDFYTAGFVVGAEVTSSSNTIIHILSDAINDIDHRDIDPFNYSIWGWSAVQGYENPNQSQLATNDNPDSWPPQWTKWKGLFGDGNVLAAKEAYFVMDDRNNREFNYYPFSDTSRKGLGVEVSCRLFQFDDLNASDILFARYDMKNVSPVPLTKVVTGFYADLDIGGGVAGGPGGVENTDDLGLFNSPLQLAYYWDHNGLGYMNRPTHYNGIVVLTTPGNPSDGIDNDGDGMIDEKQNNGNDDDGDWDVALHDLGKDGLPGTNDAGEHDGLPTNGEPNYEATDTEESDEMGVTSFKTSTIGTFRLRDDEQSWEILHQGFSDEGSSFTDIASLFGSGNFSLASGASATYALAFFCAWNLDSTITLARRAVDEYSLRLSPNGKGNSSVAVSISVPAMNQSVSNSTPVTWQSSGTLTNRMVDLWYANGPDSGWTPLALNVPDEGSYLWNTTSFQDGAFYRLRLVSKKFGNKGFAESEIFRIDNAGNAPPNAYFTSSFTSPLHDSLFVTWLAGDAEGSPVTSQLSISTNNGVTYSPLNHSPNSTQALLNTRLYANSDHCFLKLILSDGSIISEKTSPKFTIRNVYRAIVDSVISQIAGQGTGEIIPVVIDSTQLNGHQYSISFDSSDGGLVYSVFDKNANSIRIDSEPLPQILAGGSVFDGMRMTIRNHPIGLDSGKSGFEQSQPYGIVWKISKPIIGTYVPAPMDIRIEFTSLDTAVDGKYITPGDTLYSASQFIKSIPAPFRVRFSDTTIGLQAVVVENLPSTKNNRWDLNEPLVILAPSPYKKTSSSAMMQILFTAVAGTVPTVNKGDLFIGRTTKPFTSEDVFVFEASGTTLGPTGTHNTGMTPQQYSLAQNYPNPFNPATVLRYSLERNGMVTLTVYDALGREIKRLVNGEQPAGSFEVIWNGTDVTNIPVASGIYFYRIVSGNFVQTKKMLLLR